MYSTLHSFSLHSLFLILYFSIYHVYPTHFFIYLHILLLYIIYISSTISIVFYLMYVYVALLEEPKLHCSHCAFDNKPLNHSESINLPVLTITVISKHI